MPSGGNCDKLDRNAGEVWLRFNELRSGPAKQARNSPEAFEATTILHTLIFQTAGTPEARVVIVGVIGIHIPELLPGLCIRAKN